MYHTDQHVVGRIIISASTILCELWKDTRQDLQYGFQSKNRCYYILNEKYEKWIAFGQKYCIDSLDC